MLREPSGPAPVAVENLEPQGSPSFTAGYRIVEGTGLASFKGPGAVQGCTAATGRPAMKGEGDEEQQEFPLGRPTWPSEAVWASLESSCVVKSCVKNPENWQEDFMNSWCGPLFDIEPLSPLASPLRSDFEDTVLLNPYNQVCNDLASIQE